MRKTILGLLILLTTALQLRGQELDLEQLETEDSRLRAETSGPSGGVPETIEGALPEQVSAHCTGPGAGIHGGVLHQGE